MLEDDRPYITQLFKHLHQSHLTNQIWSLVRSDMTVMFFYLPNMIIAVISLVKGLFLQLVVNPPHQVTISTQVVPRDVVARASRDRAQTSLGRQLPRPPSPLHQLQPEPGQLQQHLQHLGRRRREWEL